MVVTDERDEDDVPLADAEPPGEWVESIAAAEGVPPEEVVERLVSSYWTLTEVYEMLSGTERDIGLSTADDIDLRPGSVIEDGEDASTVEDDEDASTVEDDKGASTVEDGEGTSTVEDGEGASTVENEEDAPMVEDMRELDERLDRLEEAVRAQQNSQTDVEADLGQLTQRMDGLEGELRERQSSIESRLDSELEYLETILGYLVDSTEAISEDLGSIRGEWPTVRERQAEWERLVDFKRTAAQLGVRSGECEHCGSSVDIGVLPTADCPDCDAEFVDIEPATGWFGMGTDTLVTAEETISDRS